MKIIKKISIFLIVICCVVIFFMFLIFYRNPRYIEQEFPNTKWSTENNDFWFCVEEESILRLDGNDSADDYYTSIFGEFSFEGNVYKFSAYTLPDLSFVIVSEDLPQKTQETAGSLIDCKYTLVIFDITLMNKNKIVVRVPKNDIFNPGTEYIFEPGTEFTFYAVED